MKNQPASDANLDRIENALDTLLNAAIHYAGGAQTDAPPTVEADIDKLLEEPLGASCRQSIRALGQHAFELTKSLDAMIDMAGRVAGRDPYRGGHRLSIADHAWSGIGDERARWWA